jgi:hypothetical protein
MMMIYKKLSAAYEQVLKSRKASFWEAFPVNIGIVIIVTMLQFL